MKERASQGVVKDYFEVENSSNIPGAKKSPYEYQTIMDMVTSDPIIQTAIDLTVDLITANGYSFEGKNKTDIKKAQKLFDDELDFDRIIDNILYQLLIYGNSFLEIRWNELKTVVKELHPLETTQMEIDYDEHGEIKKYYQNYDKALSPISFETDEVIFFREKWIGSQVYSQHPFESLSRSFTSKIYANYYLQSIFTNMPPKLIYFLKNASDNQRKHFIENLLRSKTNPNIDIIASGEAFDTKAQLPNFDNGLINILEYLRREVLMITRVPPHWVGLMDGANRGIGENVVIPYETKIKKVQQKVASQINRDLMPKLGLSSTMFKWNPMSLTDEKQIVEVMNFLKAQGFDGETIISYARDKGLKLRQEAYIEEPEDKMSHDNNGGNQVLANETSMSRLRKGKGDLMTNNLNKKGVSEEGGEKLSQRMEEKK